MKILGVDSITAVMSGNFVQRGEPACFNKFFRTEVALLNGINSLVELPTYWAMSSAQNFAKGAADIIKNLNINILAFGSESGDISNLLKVSDCLSSNATDTLIKEYLKEGITYAVAREKAVDSETGLGYILKNPNDILAIEYILAFKKLNYKIEFLPIKRIGVDHDAKESFENYASASTVRELIKNNKKISDFIPENSINNYNKTLENGVYYSIDFGEKAIIDRLRRITVEDLKKIADIGNEGLENRIYNAVKTSSTLAEICEKIKTKRYTMARLKRLIMYAYLDLLKEDIPDNVPYIRVLGCDDTGLKFLNEAQKTSAIPIVFRTTEIAENSVFAKENIMTDLYNGSFCKSPQNCGAEFTEGVIRHR